MSEQPKIENYTREDLINYLKAGIEERRENIERIDEMLMLLRSKYPRVLLDGDMEEKMMWVPHTHKWIVHKQSVTMPFPGISVYGTCVMCGMNYGGDPTNPESNEAKNVLKVVWLKEE